MDAKRALFISYFFPPLGGAGVQRTLKFMKYLPETGWHPVILAAQPPRSALLDQSLLKEIPSEVAVFRSPPGVLPSRLPFRIKKWIARWILLVDEQVLWLPLAVREARKIALQVALSVIYSTSPPVSNHIAAYRLKKATGLPWVADFRDPWLGNFAHSFPTAVHEKAAFSIERSILNRANRILVVSEPLREAMLDRHPHLRPDKVEVLPNGYDPQDFLGVQPANLSPNKIHLVYSGSFYQHIHTPLPFLKGLRLAHDQGGIPAGGIQVHFVGNTGKQAKSQIDALGLQESVTLAGYLPHQESIAYLLAADALLLVIPAAPGAEGVTTGKIYEYLASRKPILAVAPPGAAADIIHEAHAGVVVDPDNTQAIANHLRAFYHDWQLGRLAGTAHQEVISRYDRRLLAQRLARIFDEVTRSPEPNSPKEETA